MGDTVCLCFRIRFARFAARLSGVHIGEVFNVDESGVQRARGRGVDETLELGRIAGVVQRQIVIFLRRAR